MSKELTLAKIVAVNGIGTLDTTFEENYFPEIDMYLFFTEATYNPTTGSYSGVRKLHDRLISELNLPHLSSNEMNYISIDIKPTDRCHTYMTSNRRYYQLTEYQKQFIAKMFNADFF